MDDDARIPSFDIPSDIVYVREVPAEELPTEARSGKRVYAIHDAEGARLALTDDRKLAFRLARRHERTPVSVH